MFRFYIYLYIYIDKVGINPPFSQPKKKKLNPTIGQNKVKQNKKIYIILRPTTTQNNDDEKCHEFFFLSLTHMVFYDFHMLNLTFYQVGKVLSKKKKKQVGKVKTDRPVDILTTFHFQTMWAKRKDP